MFQQDNARPYTATVSKNFLTANGIGVLDWPAKSPDMSTIEHFWDNLGKRVRKRNLGNIHELHHALVDEYAVIPQEQITTLVRSTESESRNYG